MRLLHSIWTLMLVLAVQAPARAVPGQQAPAAPATPAQQGTPTPTSYAVFLRGAPVGREDITIRTDASTTTIAAEGRLSTPPLIIRRAEFRYRNDWTPESAALDGNFNAVDITLRTT